MAPRPNWKGYLKLSLVSCSVALYSATTTADRVRFNIINRKTGHRVRNMVIDTETEEPVERRIASRVIPSGRDSTSCWTSWARAVWARFIRPDIG